MRCQFGFGGGSRPFVSLDGAWLDASNLEQRSCLGLEACDENSAPLGPEMIKFGPNLCYCAVDQEKAVFKRKRPFLAHLPLWGPKC